MRLSSDEKRCLIGALSIAMAHSSSDAVERTRYQWLRKKLRDRDPKSIRNGGSA